AYDRVAQLTQLVGLLDRAENAVLAGHIGAHEQGAAAQLVSQRLTLVGGEIGDHHAESVCVQPTDRCLAQAARPATDDRRGALELLYRHAFSFISCCSPCECHRPSPTPTGPPRIALAGRVAARSSRSCRNPRSSSERAR